MLRTAACALAITIAAGSAHAQAPAPSAPPAPTCPASGYAQPYFGFFGDNDGVARGYEIASPCNSDAVRKAADAIGMARYKPLGVKNVSTIRFKATGQFADESGRMQAVSALDMSINYTIPAARMTIDKGGRKEGRVFADKTAWNEAAPGVGGKLASAAAVKQRAPLLKLTPFGALWSVIEAEGHAKVSTVGGRTVISGASPYDGYQVTVTLDEKDRPASVEAKAEGRTYRATFSNYKNTWEPDYFVIFPEKMTWTVDGKPLADLTVTYFHSNGYVVFPTPAELK